MGCAARTTAFDRVVARLERAAKGRENLLAVLTYHRVDWPDAAPELHAGLISATPPEFDEQMRHLASSHHLASLDELLAAREGRTRLPAGSVMVTFDDAYIDFARNAWPVLQRHGVPTTLFVPTAYPDHPERSFWWDRLSHALSQTTRVSVDTPIGTVELATSGDRVEAFSRLRTLVKATPHHEAMALVDGLSHHLGAPATPAAVLGWDELRGLGAGGVTLAAHSRTHPMLDRLEPEGQHGEISGSLGDLAEQTGAAPPAFAYPGGGVDLPATRALRLAGVRVAFTTERGGNDLGRTDWLRLRRINVGRNSSPALVRAQLLPAYLAFTSP